MTNPFTRRPALEAVAIVACAEGIVALGIFVAGFAIALGIWP